MITPDPWSNINFIKNLQETLGPNPEISQAVVSITNSNSSAVINEIYDSMIQFSSTDQGLQKLSIIRLPEASKLELMFDQDLLERLVTKTINLQ